MQDTKRPEEGQGVFKVSIVLIFILVFCLGVTVAFMNKYKDKYLALSKAEKVAMSFENQKCEVCGDSCVYAFKYIHTVHNKNHKAYYCQYCYNSDRARVGDASVMKMRKIMADFDKELAEKERKNYGKN